LFYRQVNSSNALENLPLEAVVFFDGLSAVKSQNGEWLITGESTPVSSKILGSMAPLFHIISEYSFFPSTGFDEGRVNLKHVMSFIGRYGELPWVVVFEWTRDFFGVPLNVARDAVWHLVQTGKVEHTTNETLKLTR
jgi:hypothetical protein